MVRVQPNSDICGLDMSQIVSCISVTSSGILEIFMMFQISVDEGATDRLESLARSVAAVRKFISASLTPLAIEAGAGENSASE